MIEVALCNIRGSQFAEKKHRNRCGEEIDAFAILLRLSNKLIPITITIFIIIITSKSIDFRKLKNIHGRLRIRGTLKINESL